MSIEETVREKYGAVARSALSSKDNNVAAVAKAFGYSAEELSSIPAEANMALSCGNPTATASIKPGEVVLDLGSGGGLDVFLAAQKVGPTGQAIGVDMTPDMVERARRNAKQAGITNAKFLLGEITALPIADSSVDCIISNCVINLAADKAAVFREMMRVLKPGGQVAISDIALKRELPEQLAKSVAAYVGCISGAITIADYERGLTEAGFSSVAVVDSGADLNAYALVEGQSGCCSPGMESGSKASACCTPLSQPGACCSPKTEPELPVHQGLTNLAANYDLNQYAASVKIFAVKS